MTSLRMIFGLLILVAVAAGCTKAPLPENSGTLGGDLRDQMVQAIQYGEVDTVSQLLATQPLLASAPHPSSSQTPLHMAASTGNLAIAKLLLEKGADPYALNDEGETPYDVAKRTDADQELLDLLGQ